MSAETQLAPPGAEAAPKKKSGSSAFTRIAKYTAVRTVTLFITIVVGVYLTILIANMGGYVDTIRRGEIREAISLRFMGDPVLSKLPPDVKAERMEGMIALEEQRLGLNQPFMVRSFRYLTNALTLNLGRAQNMTSDSG
jgi:peptide/nickel transport system permease protein